jgi:hypothetical protein
MSTESEEWESFLDVEDYQVERALANATLDAIYRARRFGTDIIIEEDERVKHLKPHETGPYEKQLYQQLEQLNRKIAELGGPPPASRHSRASESPFRMLTTISEGGKLELSGLPFPPGQKVEVIVAPQNLSVVVTDLTI